MITDRHMIHTSVNALLMKHGKVLLSRRQNTGWSDGLLCIPGGHVEKGETPRQAVMREIKEETGLLVDPTQLQFVCVAQRHSGDREYVAYEFMVELSSEQEPENTEAELCSELIWVSPTDLPTDVIPDFAGIITRGLLGREPYLELGYEP